MHRTWFVPVASFLLLTVGSWGANPSALIAGTAPARQSGKAPSMKLAAAPEVEEQTWEPVTVSAFRLQRDPLGQSVRAFKEAVKHLRKKRYSASLVSLDRALEFDPDFAEAYLNAGVVHLLQGHTEQAASSFERAIQLDERLLLARSNLAIACLKLGDYKRAEAAAREALNQNPNDVRAHYAWSMSRAAQGLLTFETVASLKRAATRYQEAHKVLISVSHSAPEIN